MPRSKQTMEVKPERKTSKYRGVVWDRERARWAASFRQRHIGRFATECDAAQAYDEAARKTGDELILLNFPTQAERESAAKWVDRNALCEMFNVTKHTCKDWDLKGLIDGRTCGRRKYYNREDLTPLLRQLGPVDPPWVVSPCRPGRSSSYRGVAWDEESGQWWARTNVDGQVRSFGYFDNEKDAAKAYDEAAYKLFGRYAWLNVRRADSPPTQWQIREKKRAAGIAPPPPSSQYRGVCWIGEKNIWRAHFRDRTCGYFADEREAAKAYDEAARNTGEAFLELNFPTSEERARAAEWVDRHEVCRVLDIHLATCKKWENQGFIRAQRHRRRVYYKLDEVRAMVEKWGPIQPAYPDPDRPGCYRLPLSGRGSRLSEREAIIDADCLPLVDGKLFCWTGHKDRHPHHGHVARSSQEDKTPLHRMIMNISDPDLQVIHKNGDPLDCRRENLVVKTIQEQTFGSRKQRTFRGRPCTSEYKGVCWDARREKWLAQIRKDRKHHQIGRFDSEIQAAQAYDSKARELFGEHAWLNFPNEGERGRVETDSPEIAGTLKPGEQHEHLRRAA